MSNTTKQPYGLLIEFESASTLRDACQKVREKGYSKWDAFSPFPIHGMDDAMGIRPTIIPWVTLVGGLTGLTIALVMQWWMNAVDYPFIISGKPYFSLPANIPVAFELTILLAALSTIGALFAFNMLPQLYHPLFSSQRFRRVTTDGFFIVIEAVDPIYNTTKTSQFLETLGGQAIEKVED